MTPQEADTCAAAAVGQAEPGQVLIREGEAGDWMLLLPQAGTVDVTSASRQFAMAAGGKFRPVKMPVTQQISEAAPEGA
jgi:hypothetical protein